MPGPMGGGMRGPGRRMQGGTALRNQRDKISFLNYIKISNRAEILKEGQFQSQ